MGYLNKNNDALLDIKLTDAGRKKMSEGDFKISYFQIGDSEVCYNCDGSSEPTNQFVLKSSYNQQNSSPIPERSKASVKYPIYINSNSDNTFGIPMKIPQIDSIYNTATPRGFFNGVEGSLFDRVITDADYCVNSAYQTTTSNFLGTNQINMSLLTGQTAGDIESGMFVTFYYRGLIDPINQPYPILTYKVVNITYGDEVIQLTLDRKLPSLATYTSMNSTVRAIFYSKSLVPFYDFETPDGYYTSTDFNYENNCESNGKDVKIWNMNIPWRESVAGTYNSTHIPYTDYGSVDYLSTMEYLGYYSNDGQTNTSLTQFVNSLGNRVTVNPDDQKCVAIVHYSNNTIDQFYGEKFGLRIPEDNDTDTGSAKNFRIEIPTLMWHKNKNGTIGETFYVVPPNFDDLNLFQVKEMNSNKSPFMSDPGLRYYDLWDIHANEDGYPNRVGKVWPDLKIVTFDDEEIVAMLNNKSNRNWTLPAGDISLVAPNTFNNVQANDNGVLNGTGETMWVTYRFTNNTFTNSLHSNYYLQISGKNADCPPTSANVLIKFGEEFKFLKPFQTQTNIDGFLGERIELIFQKTQTGSRPTPNGWKVFDVTNQIQGYNNSYITESNLVLTTFQITSQIYESASSYNLSNYIDIPTLGSSENILNFGDEYYFYGTIKTDIQATIYVMNFACNLGGSQFMRSSNPTATNGTTPYVTEIGLYDDRKDLMVIAKVQSPEKRNGVQQYSLKLDF